MKPIIFKDTNQVYRRHAFRPLTLVGKEEVKDLPAFTDGQFCVSCWKMSLREKLSALLFGRIWLSVFSGSTQPPVSLSVQRYRMLK